MKKKNSGIIIRLIDVVLILLFGFISISQLEKRSKVKLPVSSESKIAIPDSENLIQVAIFQYQPGKWGFLVDNETVLLKDINVMHRYLRRKKEFFKGEIRIKIYSEAKAPMKYTMQLADLCEQLNLKKSLIVKLKNRQSGLQISE